MKRLQYDHYGGPEVMRLAEFEPPRPGPDEVLVRVRAAASNALDRKMRNGELKLMTDQAALFAQGVTTPNAVVAIRSDVELGWDAASGWSSWFRIRSWQARSDATVTAIARIPNQIDLFTTGVDGRIISISWTDPGGWATEWFTVGKAFTTSPSNVTALARSSTHIDLFAVDTFDGDLNGNAITAAWDISTGWSAWRSLSGKPVGGGQVAAVSRFGGSHIDLLYVDVVVKNLQWDSASGWTLPFDAAGD